MDPKTIATLQENHPEFKELLAYLAAKASELNTLDGLAGMTVTERAYEATARLRAYDKLLEILGPLVHRQQSTSSSPSGEEYVV